MRIGALGASIQITCNCITNIPVLAAAGNSCEFGSAQYYAYCGFGGLLSCGLTHTAVVPLDLVKCRIQVDPAKYKGIVNGFKISVAEEGMRGK